MDRVENIDIFLKKLANYYRWLPNKELNHDFVYAQLVTYGVNKSRPKPRKYFYNWVKNYKDDKSIDVFVHSSYRYFCHFKKENIIPNDFPFKLYLPIDGDYIEQAAIELFDFIKSTGMKHTSKIASEVRNDDIVIRVNNIEDVIKIINFVSLNDNIKKGLLDTNPFVINQNGVGLAEDGNLSYNSEISKIINAYLKDKKLNNKLDDVSFEDFRRCVNNNSILYNNYQDIDREYIFKLLKISLDPTSDINTLNRHINNKRKQFDLEKIHLIKRVIMTNYTKYGYNHISNALFDYIKNGNLRGFTNTDNSRKIVANVFTPESIKNIIYSSLYQLGYNTDENISLKDCINTFLSNLNSLPISKLELVSNNNESNVIPKQISQKSSTKSRYIELQKQLENLKKDNEMLDEEIETSHLSM